MREEWNMKKRGSQIHRERRIERDVDKAIEGYWEESEKVNPEPPVIPIFSEEKEGDTPLGGEMRIRSPWVDPTDSD